jgi:uncharacterized membrane protein YfcA
MPYDLDVLVAGPVVMVLAYTVFGLSGFGSALISIPLLAHFLPLRSVVPVMLLLDFSAALTTGWRSRREIDRREVRTVIPGIVAGAVTGVLLLARAPGDRLLLPLAVFVMVCGAYNALRHEHPVAFTERWAPGVGFLGGFIGALYGVGGPVYAAYFAGRLRDPARLRATLSVVFSLSTSLRIALFLLSGLLLERGPWMLAGFLFPFMLLGTQLGRRAQHHLSRRSATRIVGVLLMASGASLFARALA